MKNYFLYYHSYYEVCKSLNEENFLLFNNALFDCHFSSEDTIQKVNSVIFNNDTLDKAWKTVKEQVKRHDRSSKNYRTWKNEVFKRDNNTCTKCGSIEKIEAHHIIRWADNINSRYDVNNGITLCYKCHKEEHRNKYGN